MPESYGSGVDISGVGTKKGVLARLLIGSMPTAARGSSDISGTSLIGVGMEGLAHGESAKESKLRLVDGFVMMLYIRS